MAYICSMEALSEIKNTLRQLKPALKKKYPIRSLGLFGSVVRNDFSASSDIDIIVDFTQPVGIEFIDLADELEQQLKRKVDLVSRNGIKDRYFNTIQQDIV